MHKKSERPHWARLIVPFTANDSSGLRVLRLTGVTQLFQELREYVLDEDMAEWGAEALLAASVWCQGDRTDDLYLTNDSLDCIAYVIRGPAAPDEPDVPLQERVYLIGDNADFSDGSAHLAGWNDLAEVNEPEIMAAIEGIRVGATETLGMCDHLLRIA